MAGNKNKKNKNKNKKDKKGGPKSSAKKAFKGPAKAGKSEAQPVAKKKSDTPVLSEVKGNRIDITGLIELHSEAVVIAHGHEITIDAEGVLKTRSARVLIEEERIGRSIPLGLMPGREKENFDRPSDDEDGDTSPPWDYTPG